MKQLEKKDMVKLLADPLAAALPQLEKHLKVIASGTAVATRKGRDFVPEADYALAIPDVRSAPLRHIAPVAEKGSLRNMPSASLRDAESMKPLKFPVRKR
jgi:hypothetical protein